MIITLELSPDLELKLRQSIAVHDTESVRKLLTDAFTPTIETLLRQEAARPNNDEFEAIADRLSEELVAHINSDTPLLSDYAVSRAGIYQERHI